MKGGTHFVNAHTSGFRWVLQADTLPGVRAVVFFFSSRRRHTRSDRDWSSDVCSSDLVQLVLSRDLARKVIADLKLGERAEFDPVLRGISPLRHMLTLTGLAKDPLKMSPEERVLESWYERLTAYQVEKSRVIAIEFQSADPD